QEEEGKAAAVQAFNLYHATFDVGAAEEGPGHLETGDALKLANILLCPFVEEIEMALALVTVLLLTDDEDIAVLQTAAWAHNLASEYADAAAFLQRALALVERDQPEGAEMLAAEMREQIQALTAVPQP
ncbi:hypothetical protein KIPB_014736, partial [Kipferlia bialata]